MKRAQDESNRFSDRWIPQSTQHRTETIILDKLVFIDFVELRVKRTRPSPRPTVNDTPSTGDN